MLESLRQDPVAKSYLDQADEIVSESEKRRLDTTLQDFTLVTGIANADSLVDFLKSKNLNFNHLNFNDHHEFSDQDIQMLSKKKFVITTEKDFMRLMTYESLKAL